MTDRNREELKQSFVKMIEQKNNKYHFTVTFRSGTTDHNALKSFNLLLDRINQKAFCVRYHKYADKHLTGFVARERNTNGTYHFHSVLSDDNLNLPDMKSLKAAISKAIPTIKLSNGRQMIGNYCWCLQQYFNDGNSALEQYITKNIVDKRLSYDEAFDSIGIISKQQAFFGS